MKSIFRKFLVIAGTLCVCLSLSSFSTSLDGRAVVVNDGVFPQGLFAKTVGYLPGDIISVANIAGDSTVDLLVIGALDPSEGVAIMLSPEAAKAVGINKDDNNIVKITKRSGQDERVYGTAVIAKQNTPVKSSVSELPVIEEEAADAFDEAVASNTPAVISATPDVEETPAFEEEEFTPAETVAYEETAVPEEIVPFEEEPAVETLVAEAPVEESVYDEVPVEDVPFEEESPFEPATEEIAQAEPEVETEEPFEEEFIPSSEPIAYEEVEQDEFENIEEPEPFEEPEEFEEIAATPDEPEEETPFEEEVPVFAEETVEEDNLPEELAYVDNLDELDDGEPEEFIEEDFYPEELEDTTENSELVFAENLDPLESEDEEVALVDEFDDFDEFDNSEDDELDAVIEAELEDYDNSLLANSEEEYEEYEDDEEEYTAIVLVPVDSILPDTSSLKAESEEDYTIAEVESIIPDTKPVVANAHVTDKKYDYSKYVVSDFNSLKSGSYYVQIADYNTDASIQSVVDTYSKNYPMSIIKGKILIGPLNVDEYAVVLERFKSYGYKNSFIRKIN